MRLISQSGGFDFPYELSTITISGETIFARVSGFGENHIMIAMYSTPEKAQKAMKMLHDTVAGMFLGQNIEFDTEIGNDLTAMIQKKGFGIITVSRDSRDVEFKPANIIFKFPKDDEI